MRPSTIAAAFLLTTLTTGCAGPPKALEGEFSALRPEVATESDIGTHVRWGGRLVTVEPERERTCFEILSLPLGSNARPDGDATPGRRFLACRDGFADPAAYPRERLVTITGELTDFTTREIGEYALPRRARSRDAPVAAATAAIRSLSRHAPLGLRAVPLGPLPLRTPTLPLVARKIGRR